MLEIRRGKKSQTAVRNKHAVTVNNWSCQLLTVTNHSEGFISYAMLVVVFVVFSITIDKSG